MNEPKDVTKDFPVRYSYTCGICLNNFYSEEEKEIREITIVMPKEKSNEKKIRLPICKKCKENLW